MKKVSIISIAVLLIAVIFLAFNQTDQDKSLARVQRVQGKYVYVMCDPVNDYEIVGEVNTVISKLISTDLQFTEQVKELVAKASDKERRGKIEKFDGIITEDGEIGTLIKFKE